MFQAALNNPNVPEETKEHSRQMIDELEQQPETQAARERSQEGKEENRVIGGYKATLKSGFFRPASMTCHVLIRTCQTPTLARRPSSMRRSSSKSGMRCRGILSASREQGSRSFNHNVY